MLTPIRAIAVAALIALSAAVAIPALTSAQNGAGREIAVREKVRAVKFVHANPSTLGERLAHGDRVLTRQALFAEDGSAVGRLFTDCANVGRGAEVFDATLQCLSTYRFEDGEVVGAGVVVLSAARTVRFPIVGGSGAYRGAHGEVTSGKPPKGYQGADVLHLDG
jgi:Allene oxide cyclase barrel like domain